MKPFLLAYAAIATLGLVAPAFAQSDEAPAQEPAETGMVKPSISFSEALQIAISNGTGDVYSMELDPNGEIPTYIVDMGDDTTTQGMVIDATTGKVLMKASMILETAEEFDRALLRNSGFSTIFEDGFHDYHHDEEFDEKELLHEICAELAEHNDAD